MHPGNAHVLNTMDTGSARAGQAHPLATVCRNGRSFPVIFDPPFPSVGRNAGRRRHAWDVVGFPTPNIPEKGARSFHKWGMWRS